MLIKGNDTERIKSGNILSDNQFLGETFDYIISNPSFCREWKNQKVIVKNEAKLGFEDEFCPGLPSIADEQMLFLESTIKKINPLGSHIAIVLSGSPLFTGDASRCPSEIRRYILGNNLLEAIIALPNSIFYNTGILELQPISGCFQIRKLIHLEKGRCNSLMQMIYMKNDVSH